MPKGKKKVIQVKKKVIIIIITKIFQYTIFTKIHLYIQVIFGIYLLKNHKPKAEIWVTKL